MPDAPETPEVGSEPDDTAAGKSGTMPDSSPSTPKRQWQETAAVWLRKPLTWVVLIAVIVLSVGAGLVYSVVTRFDPTTMASFEREATSDDVNVLKQAIRDRTGYSSYMSLSYKSIYDPNPVDTTIEVSTHIVAKGQTADDPELVALRDTVEEVIWSQHFDVGRFQLSASLTDAQGILSPTVMLDRTSRRDKLRSLGITPTVDMSAWPKSSESGLRKGAVEDKPGLEAAIKAVPHVTSVTLTCTCTVPQTIWYDGPTEIAVGTDLPTSPEDDYLSRGYGEQEDLLKLLVEVKRVLWQQPFDIGTVSLTATSVDAAHRTKAWADRHDLEVEFGPQPTPRHGDMADAVAIKAAVTAIPQVEDVDLFCNCSEVTAKNGTGEVSRLSIAAFLLAPEVTVAKNDPTMIAIADEIEKAIWARGGAFGPIHIDVESVDGHAYTATPTMADLVAKFGPLGGVPTSPQTSPTPK